MGKIFSVEITDFLGSGWFIEKSNYIGALSRYAWKVQFLIHIECYQKRNWLILPELSRISFLQTPCDGWVLDWPTFKWTQQRKNFWKSYSATHLVSTKEQRKIIFLPAQYISTARLSNMLLSIPVEARRAEALPR